jgi:hypothetical protein
MLNSDKEIAKKMLEYDNGCKCRKCCERRYNQMMRAGYEPAVAAKASGILEA